MMPMPGTNLYATTSVQEVIIFHDETKNAPETNFKGHVLFFVPTKLSITENTPLFGEEIIEYSPLNLLFGKILELRQTYCCDGKLHFSKLSGQLWKKYDFAYRYSIEAAIDSLRHKFPNCFQYPLHCKLAIILYPPKANILLYGGDTKPEKKLRHDETLLRILLKGAAHFLYDDNNKVEVSKIITDGKAFHRLLDEDRVVWKLTYDGLHGRTPLRDYVTFSENANIIHLPSNHKEYSPESDEYKLANMLQIADLLLGAVMRACYVGMKSQNYLPQIDTPCVKRDIIAQPVKEMLEKQKRGSGFKNSGHYKSFSITEASFTNTGIHFRKIPPLELSITDQEGLQLSLFNNQ